MLNEKRTFLLTLITAALAACSPSPVERDSKVTPQLAKGGIDGGGGGTLPSRGMSPQEVFEIVQDARRDLRLVVKYLENRAPTTEGTVKAKLFGRKRTLWHELEETLIEVEMNQPCFDAHGTAVDGSVHASRPDTICISAFTTAPKLIQEQARNEITALIVHELSHRLGTTEAEAEEIQRETAYYLKGVGPNTSQEWVSLLFEKSQEIYQDLSILAERLPKLDARDASRELSNISVKLQSLHSAAYKLSFSPFNKREWHYHHLQSIRFQLATWYVDSLLEDGRQHYAREKYEQVFRHQEVVTLGEYELNLWNSTTSNQYADQPIDRMKSLQQVSLLLESLSDYMGGVAAYLENLKWNGSLHSFAPLPQGLQLNPWSDFTGSYQVIQAQCSAETGLADLKTIKIEQTASGQVYLTRSSSHGASVIGVYEGARFGSLTTYTRTARDGLRAQFIAEKGITSGPQWQVTTLSIEPLENAFKMTESRLTRNWADPEADELLSSECVWTLKKTLP